jgi:hypothetical protein
VVVGIVISVVNATKNRETAARREVLEGRLHVLRDELQRSTSLLEPWRSGLADVTPLTTVFTF